ncbi:MAG: hypothetical protein ABR567_09480 [Myxococcales bacterium]
MLEQRPPATSTVLASLRLRGYLELRFQKTREGFVLREWRHRDGTWCSKGQGIRLAVGELRSVAAVLERLANRAEAGLR